jgi:hypothetical protein
MLLYWGDYLMWGIFIDARFLLLHEGKSEDAIKNFFNEVYDLFVKVITKSNLIHNLLLNIGSDESIL